MLSLRARIIKSLLRASSSKSVYTNETIALHRRKFDRNLSAMFPSSDRGVSREVIGGTTVYIYEPAKSPAKRSIIYLHGGGFIMGSTKSHMHRVKSLARACDAKIISIEYSLAPEAIYPQAINEIQAVWEYLIKQKTVNPSHTSFMGDSAGGNLACASLLRFKAQNIPMPGCIVLVSPALDGTFSGKSYQENAANDPLLNQAKLNVFINSYIGEAPKHDPNVSPIFADLKGFPPMLIHAGSDEILLSDSQTIYEHAKRDGVDSTLFVGDELWHGWHFFASYFPEAKQAMEHIAQFVKRNS